MSVDVDQESDRITGQVLGAIARDGQPLTVISAPPGAGKTSLIETLTAVLVYHGLRVGVVTPRHSQLDALLDRLLGNYPGLTPVQVLQSAQRAAPPSLARYPGRATLTSDARQLSRGSGVTLATAAKLRYAMSSLDGVLDVLVCDESWMLSYATMAPLLSAARQTVLIGDPGQLPPLMRIPSGRYGLALIPVHRPAPEILLAMHPRAAQFQLPYSRRLKQGAVDLIQPAFYPGMTFQAATRPSERRLALSGRSTGSAVDRVLDLVAEEGASIVSLVLPARTAGSAGGVDEEIAQVEASVVRRLLDRKARWVRNRVLRDTDIGCINARVREGAAVRRRLRGAGISTGNVWTDTPEAWQGQERPVIIARHPVSGLSKLSGFDLETGRFCVMLTRSSICTILTYRDGVSEALQAHNHDCGSRELGQSDDSYRGWSAHISLLAALESKGWTVRV